MSTAGPPAAPTPRLSAFAALQHRDFAVFAVARLCATLAWQILGAAVGYQVYQLTRDPLALAFVGARAVRAIRAARAAGGTGRGSIRPSHRADLRVRGRSDVRGLLLWFTLSGLKDVWPVFVAMTFFGAGARSGCLRDRPSRQSRPREAFPSAVAVNSTLFQSA